MENSTNLIWVEIFWSFLVGNVVQNDETPVVAYEELQIRFDAIITKLLNFKIWI